MIDANVPFGMSSPGCPLAAVLLVPGVPVYPDRNGNGGHIQEVFDIDDADNILQLTAFGRADTFAPTVSADGQRIFFSASANPLGDANPTENCQLFSIDRTGGDLRQLTNFHESAAHSVNGCSFGTRPLGCPVFSVGRDIHTDAVLFYSSCDPFGDNPNGSQVFAIHPDGTGLRQLTTARGLAVDTSGATVELPFPYAYPGFQLANQL